MNKGLQTLIPKKVWVRKYAIIADAEFRVTRSKSDAQRFEVYHWRDCLKSCTTEADAHRKKRDARRMLVLSDYFLRVMPCLRMHNGSMTL